MTDLDLAITAVFDLYEKYAVHGSWDRFLAEREAYLATLGWKVDEFLARADELTDSYLEN